MCTDFIILKGLYIKKKTNKEKKKEKNSQIYRTHHSLAHMSMIQHRSGRSISYLTVYLLFALHAGTYTPKIKFGEIN